MRAGLASKGGSASDSQWNLEHVTQSQLIEIPLYLVASFVT